MVPLADAIALVRASLAEWQNTRLAALGFARRDLVFVALIILLGLSSAAILLRSLMRRVPGRYEVALPAILRWSRPSRLSVGRHAVIVLLLAGVPFFAIALADPYTALTRQDVTYPGRRIALMIDASASMLTRFPSAPSVGPSAPGGGAAFFTTVAAAETFIRQRMKGQYRDLIGLVEFGDEAYVITPFTTDYDNVLLSLSLIGDVAEVARFPDQGTTIANALERSVDLFRAFDFLNASGNLMVLFSDGQDRQLTTNGTPVDDILARARQNNIPVYMIRTAFNKAAGVIVPDGVWQPAIEATGGRFYSAADEATIFRAVREIDQLSGGKVALKQYSSEQPRFAGFAVIAAGLWTLAAALKLTVPYFQTFP